MRARRAKQTAVDVLAREPPLPKPMPRPESATARLARELGRLNDHNEAMRVYQRELIDAIKANTKTHGETRDVLSDLRDEVMSIRELAERTTTNGHTRQEAAQGE